METTPTLFTDDDLRRRFFLYVSLPEDLLDPDTCWIWTGGKSAHGYGAVHCGKKKQASHRVMAASTHGGWEALDGRVVLHSCDNTGCVSPFHLRVGTQRDNMEDARIRGRLAVGERHGKAKLTPSQVQDIRRSLTEGRTIRELAREYGMSNHAIGQINRGNTWKSLSGDKEPGASYSTRLPGNPQLTEDQVREIRSRSAAGETNAALGQAFGVSHMQISRIKRRVQRTDVPD